MHEHPAVQANLELHARAAASVSEARQRPPRLPGRAGRRSALPEPARLLAACEAKVHDAPPAARASPHRAPGEVCACSSPLGGTREPIDSVRFAGNSSSGRMGLALAQAARERGAEVTVIAARHRDRAPPRDRVAGGAHGGRAPGSLRARTARVRHPADGRRSRRLPARRARQREAQEGRPRTAAPRLQADRRRAPAGSPRSVVPVRRSSGSPPSTARGPRVRARQAAREGSRRGRPQRHLARRHRLRGRPQRGHDRSPPTATDRRSSSTSRSLQGACRRGDPRRRAASCAARRV